MVASWNSEKAVTKDIVSLLSQVVLSLPKDGGSASIEEISFADLGVDSLAGIEFAHIVVNHFADPAKGIHHLEINPTNMIYDFPTISSLSKHIVNRIGTRTKQSVPKTTLGMNLSSSSKFLHGQANGTQKVTANFNAENVARKFHMNTRDSPKKIGLLFTGQGSQFFGMCKDLYFSNLVFRSNMMKINTLYGSIGENNGSCLLDYMFDPCGKLEGMNAIEQECFKNMIDDTKFSQIGLFAIEYSLFQMLKQQIEAMHVKVDFVLCGHSIGEYVSAVVSEMISLEDAVKLVSARGKAMSECNRDIGIMSALRCDSELAKTAIVESKMQAYVSLAAVNGPKSCVISGDKAHLQTVLDKLVELSGSRISSKKLTVSHAFHSPLMRPAVPKLEAALHEVDFAGPTVPFVSTLTGELIESPSKVYWIDQLLGTVNFDAAFSRMLEFGVRTFVELGPSPTLIKFGKDIALSRLSKDDFSRLKLMNMMDKNIEDNIALASFFSELAKTVVSREQEAAVKSTGKSSSSLGEIRKRNLHISRCANQIATKTSALGSAGNNASGVSPSKSRSTERKLDILVEQLFNPDTLIKRLESRLLDRLLERYNPPRDMNVSNLPGVVPISTFDGVTVPTLKRFVSKEGSTSSTILRTGSPLSTSPNSLIDLERSRPNSVPRPVQDFSVQPMEGSTGLVLEVNGNGKLGMEKLSHFIRGNIDSLMKEFHCRGAILFRDCQLATAEDFRAILGLFQFDGSQIRDYLDGISPRTKVIEGVYTSTEYSAAHDMAVHNEMSYNPKPPSKIAFFCVNPPVPATGRTPLASSAEILKRLPGGLIDRFRQKGLEYIVNSPSEGKGPGVSWQKMYQTDDKSRVESICAELDVRVRWNDDDSLTTFRTASALRYNEYVNLDTWFNHAHLFHPSDLPERTQSAIASMYGKDVDRYPKYCRFADGTEIDRSDLVVIRAAQKQCTISFDWKKGDVLVIDNFILCHGRQAFDASITPPRKILASMLF